MAHLSEGLQQLADHYGIAREFWDWKGRHTTIAPETIIRVLDALGVDGSTDEACRAALDAVEQRHWRRVLPPCTVVEEGTAVHVNVHVPAGTPLGVQVVLESGERRHGQQVENWNPEREVDGRLRGEATFQLGSDLPLGYHRIEATTAEGVTSASLIVTPGFLGLPARTRGERVWGYATQLYSVPSSRSWGVGDLADLADLMSWAGAEQGAGYVLINPLHAAQPISPMEPSPYLPASRRFTNPLYIRPEAIDEYDDLDVADRRRVDELREALSPRRAIRATIDRSSAWDAKRQALALVYDAPRRPARQIAFDHYRRVEGDALHRFAIWSVLSEEFGANWFEWDEDYRDPTSDAVRRFAERHAHRVQFFEWLQWVAQTQVSAAQTAAEEVGMPVGVVTDLAVGVSASGAETWMMPRLFAHGVKVGAPPDQYNQAGQEWGQPPWRPDVMEELAFEPFRALVSATLRRAGGVRIDHIIGLFRLWWVPEGMSPRDGTYVRNNHEAMVGILALEALRAQALVVGEDLGTVEPWVRQYLARRGILGTSVLWFENNEQGDPLEAHHWRELCMASVTTHDLPPSLGYLAGDHVKLRDDLGLLTEPLETELAYAEQEQAAWLQRLKDWGLISDEQLGDHVEVMLALHRYLVLTPSKVLLAALTDAVGEHRTQNQPGTQDEYPNWRIPLAGQDGLPILLDDVFESALPRRIAEVMNG